MGDVLNRLRAAQNIRCDVRCWRIGAAADYVNGVCVECGSPEPAEPKEMNMKKPCGKCPFRKTSMKGWVGGHNNSQEIIDIAWFDGRFPCHMKVNEIVDSGEMKFGEAVKEAELCAGALILMNNSCKRSRNREISQAQDQVDECDDVFSHPSEMTEHHGG